MIYVLTDVAVSVSTFSYDMLVFGKDVFVEIFFFIKEKEEKELTNRLVIGKFNEKSREVIRKLEKVIHSSCRLFLNL